MKPFTSYFSRSLQIFFLLSFAQTTSVGILEPCENTLSKIAVNPLRHKGNKIQEKYFNLIDQVAKEFAGKPALISAPTWRKRTAAEGLPALDLPIDVGGKNLPPSDMIKIFEHAGRHDLNLRDVVGGAHARVLLQSDNPEHKTLLKQFARGEGYMAIAITEPEVGSDIRGMKSTAKKVKGGYELTGEKLYNARFETATHIILLTQAPGRDSKPGKLNAFLIPKDYPGLKFTKLDTPALRGNSFGGVAFENLFVPESFRIGQDGDGGKVFRNHFTYWRLMQTAAAVGTAKRSLEITNNRLREREAFGKKLGTMTHLQQELSDHTITLDAQTAYIEKAARLLDEGNYEEAAILVAGAKAKAVEAATKAAEFAVMTHGAAGVSSQYDLFQRYIDIFGLRIADGTSDVMRSEYLRKIYGNDLWEMAFGSNQ